MISVSLFGVRFRIFSPPQPIFLKWFLRWDRQDLSFAGSLDCVLPIFPSEKVSQRCGYPSKIHYPLWLSNQTNCSLLGLIDSNAASLPGCPAGPVLVSFFIFKNAIYLSDDLKNFLNIPLNLKRLILLWCTLIGNTQTIYYNLNTHPLKKKLKILVL